jgi:hypothetical protein
MTSAPIERVDTRAFRLATEDGPESDGTAVWDATTMVLAEVRAGGVTGIGYSYVDRPFARGSRVLVGLLEETFAAGQHGARLVDLAGQHLAQLVEQVEHVLAGDDAGGRHGYGPGRLDGLGEFGQQPVRLAQRFVNHRIRPLTSPAGALLQPLQNAGRDER